MPSSPYSWLLGPGDALQPYFGTPTRVKLWLNAVKVPSLDDLDADVSIKQSAYGQWIAQLLDCQLGTDFVTLYGNDKAAEPPPFTLSPNAIAKLSAYFANNAPPAQAASYRRRKGRQKPASTKK